jgi:hypothetical protein
MNRAKLLLAAIGATAMLGGLSAAWADPVSAPASIPAAAAAPSATPAKPQAKAVSTVKVAKARSKAKSKGERRMARRHEGRHEKVLAMKHAHGDKLAKASHKTARTETKAG